MSNRIKGNLFEKIPVWVKVNDSRLKVYSCFKELDTDLYYVQSANFFDYPLKKEIVSDHNDMEVDLFLSTPPNERDKGYPTLKEAIYEFDLYHGID